MMGNILFQSFWCLESSEVRVRSRGGPGVEVGYFAGSAGGLHGQVSCLLSLCEEWNGCGVWALGEHLDSGPGPGPRVTEQSQGLYGSLMAVS